MTREKISEDVKSHKNARLSRTLRDKDNVVTITVPNFTEYIKIANSRMAKPIIRGKRKIPKKYLDETKYAFDSRDRLIEKDTGRIVPGNPGVVGKPRYWRVNGQDIYNQKVKTFQRNNYIGMLHNYFSELFEKEFKNIRIKQFPLNLTIIFYVKDMQDHNIDNDNKWIWEKVIQDTLVESKILPDDNPKIICQNTKRTVLVEEDKDVKLIIKLDYDRG